jgi:5,10-methylenetetrahydromethanopterin reductase
MGVSAREPVRRAVEIIKQADQLNVDCAWLLDSQLLLKDPYVVMALAVEATERIKLGTGVTNPLTRHLTVTANVVSTLRSLSEGRILLGIGSGDAAVLPLGISSASLQQCEDAMAKLRQLMSGNPASFGDWTVRVAVGAGAAPIFLAASGPRMLQLAGRAADGVIVMGPAEPELVADQIRVVRASAEAAGRKPSAVFVDLWVTLSARDDPREAIQDVKPWAASQARWLARSKNLHPRLAAFQPEIDKVAQSYNFGQHLSQRAGGPSTVSDAFAVTVAVAGDHEYCRARLRELAALGVDRITVSLLPGGRQQRLADLAQRVFPND